MKNFAEVGEEHQEAMKVEEEPLIGGGNPESVTEDTGAEQEDAARKEREAMEVAEIRERMEQTVEEEEAADLSKMTEEELLSEIENAEHPFEEEFALLEALPDPEAGGLRGKLAQWQVDVKFSREPREEFIEKIAGAINSAIAEGRLDKNFLRGFDRMISVGSGHGENPYRLLRDYMSPQARAIFIEPDALPAQTIAEDGRVEYLRQRFEEVKIVNRGDERNVIEASNFLQLYETDGKVEALKKMIRLAGDGGKIVLVDEVKREGAAGNFDRVMNKVYNPGQKKYERLHLAEYEKMFSELGLCAVVADQYNRGSMLFFLEVTDRAMAMAESEQAETLPEQGA